MYRPFLLVILALAACAPGDEKSKDSDGEPAPGCDGGVAAIDAWPDGDGDGFGDDAAMETACALPDGFVATGGDCDDTQAAINPGAVEICDAANTDEDCDGLSDDDDPAVDAAGQVAAWEDGDGDGYGDPDAPGSWCDLPSGWVSEDTDCDDARLEVNPGAAEVCDQLDDDCDGDVDEADASDAQSWQTDADGDGYGDPSSATVACDAPAGTVADDTDCDDGSDDVHPGAEELCDGEDDDCDGGVDEDAVDADTWYADADRDGYGDPTAPTILCEQLAGYEANAADCDDTDASVRPDAAELCDGADTDEDCDGLADDDDSSVADAGKTAWYGDGDGDGYGDASSGSTLACDAPAGRVADDQDCDDGDASIHPAASEVCDAADTDEDCDGLADDDDASASGTTAGYLDADGDAYGDATVAIARCDLPSGYVASSLDCDDTDPTINPVATEVCDAADTDEDCDGLSDDDDASVSASGMTDWYVDADGDTYGSGTASIAACDEPAGYGEDSDDCDDADSAINPGAAEVCGDAVDDNCDGVTACDTEVADADRAFTGEGTNSYFSISVVSAGDQNGDGIDDLLFGTDITSTTASSEVAFVVNGGGTGALAASSSDAIFSSVATTTSGGGGSGCPPGPGPGPGPGPCGGGTWSTTTVTLTGSSLAGIGDIDADGYDDMAIGGDGTSSNEGIVYVVLGPQTGASDLSVAYANWSGTTTSDLAGVVQPTGDVNGDGTDDLLVGAEGYSSSTGAVYLITSYTSGTQTTATIATATFTGESAGDYLTATGGRGDLDGDGYEDVILGAYGDDDIGTDSGAAYILLGPQTGSVAASAADLKLVGEAAGDRAGEYTSVGDLDGDGYDDLVVVANQYSWYGAVYVLNGPFTTAWTLATADARVDTARATGPFAVAADGDVDPDGYDDLLLGYPYDNTSGGYGGAGALLHGPITGTLGEDDAEWYITGTAGGEWVGLSLAYVGSQDASAGDDVILGAPYTSPSGAAYLFYGDQI